MTIPATIHHVLDFRLFTFGKQPILVSTIVTVILVMAATVVVSRMVRPLVARALSRRGGRSEQTAAMTRLTHYIFLLVGVAVALTASGIDIGTMFTAGAIFAVGLGLAMQNVAENFVAGVILYTERTVRPGDILSVDGVIVRVIDIGIRSSVAQTRDGEDLVMPNSALIQKTVKNYTLKNATVRLRVPVGVHYDADMALVRETLTEATRAVSRKWAVADREPLIAMMEFGNNSVNWEVGIWMDDPWEWRPAISDLHEAIWKSFKQKHIVIAFPQMDLHLDKPVIASLERISMRGTE